MGGLPAGGGGCRLPGRAGDARCPPGASRCPEGDHLDLRLDWLLLRGMDALESRTISTQRADCGFAPRPGSALAAFAGKELSDHNAVWASCALPPVKK